MIKTVIFLWSFTIIHLTVWARQQPKMAAQNPSPMTENIRPHHRVPEKKFPGVYEEWDNLLPSTVKFFMPTQHAPDSLNLLIHFHGSPQAANYAVHNHPGWAAITLNLGSGSSIYADQFSDAKILEQLLLSASNAIEKPIRAVYLSGWSAGYGAIRSILRSENKAKIRGIILLDGMHADYVPKGTPLAAGGEIDQNDLFPFVDYAKSSIAGETYFIFTHSAVFPGTYASTTECADYLIRSLSLKLTPQLQQGPMGMQQLGKTAKGNLQIIAYAGNSAPDHVDHLHGLYYFLKMIGRNTEQDDS
ncbi:hypothetical protein Echvi_2837 [Echinicola vietnamensis DSM 17526]|uniref:Uncharacterized protein n=2 Tax=Echinicola TaxID=390846 RepID=L0G280_ECHVK|nr:hypothetical protein Echvi_2837 [Echinicola vietnamensis DSM 17526]